MIAPTPVFITLTYALSPRLVTPSFLVTTRRTRALDNRSNRGLPGGSRVPGSVGPANCSKLLSGEWLTGDEGVEDLCRGRLGAHQIGDPAFLGADNGEGH